METSCNHESKDAPVGTLFVVSTPIGNLEDITLRAIRILKEADFVVAEDTRHSKILLEKYGIKSPVLSFHSHSTDAQMDKLLALLKEGKKLALISDAGTPGISDPGYVLIKKAVEINIKIEVIPGASAVITALASSSLPSNRFLYLGYLPLKKGRQTLFKELALYPYTLVIYESPYRLLKSLSQLHDALGNRKIAVCREMTKKFEEIFRGTIKSATEHFSNKKILGEFTLVIGPESI